MGSCVDYAQIGLGTDFHFPSNQGIKRAVIRSIKLLKMIPTIAITNKTAYSSLTRNVCQANQSRTPKPFLAEIISTLIAITKPVFAARRKPAMMEGILPGIRI